MSLGVTPKRLPAVVADGKARLVARSAAELGTSWAAACVMFAALLLRAGFSTDIPSRDGNCR